MQACIIFGKMIRIRLPNTSEATLEAGRWQCQDTRLEQLLNAMRAPWNNHVSEAHAELCEAKVVSKVLKAEILEGA